MRLNNMEEYIVNSDDGNGFYKIWTATDVEYVNPIEYYSNYEINKVISLERDLIFIQNPKLLSELNQEFFQKRAQEQWDEKYKKIVATEIQESFLKLLESTKKREQEKLLKGQ